MKKLLLLLLFPLCGAAAPVPVDSDSLDDLRARLKSSTPENSWLLETRDDVTKELSNISHRQKAEASLQRQAEIRALNVLEFYKFYMNRSNRHFSLIKAPFVPVEAPAFPDYQAEKGLFAQGQKITDTFRFAGAKDEETEFEFQLYTLKNGLDFTIQTGEFKNENGETLPGSLVAIRNVTASKKSALSSVYRAACHIPADAEAGLYSGSLLVTCGGENYTIKLLLRVYPFSLPPALSFDEKTPYCVFVPENEGKSFKSGTEIIAPERTDKNVILLHPKETLLPDSVLKEGRIATFGTTEQFIHMPSEHVLHIQETIKSKDADRWHAVRGRILYAPGAAERSGNVLRRMAGVLPYRNHYNGVFLAGSYNAAALREAETDVRYITLLRSLLKKAYAEKHYSGIFAGKKAVSWLMDQDLTDYNLDLLRYELADHITYILNVMSKPTAEVQK